MNRTVRDIDIRRNAAKTSDSRMKTDCWICTPRHQIKRIRNSLVILYGTLKSRRARRLFPKYTIKPVDNFLNAAGATFRATLDFSRLFDRYIARRSVCTLPPIMAAIIIDQRLVAASFHADKYARPIALKHHAVRWPRVTDAR